MQENPGNDKEAREELFGDADNDLVPANVDDAVLDSFTVPFGQRVRSQTRTAPEALPGVPTALLDRFGTVLCRQDITTPNSALLCPILHGQKGSANKMIAEHYDLFCSWVLAQVRYCDLWRTLRDSDQPPNCFLLEALRTQALEEHHRRLATQVEYPKALEILYNKYKQISQDGHSVVSELFKGSINERAGILEAFDAGRLFLTTCHFEGKTELIKPGTPYLPHEKKPINLMNNEVRLLRKQQMQIDDEKALEILGRWQEYSTQDFESRNQHMFTESASQGLTVVAVGRRHFSSVQSNRGEPWRPPIESHFATMRHCVLDFNGAEELFQLFNSKKSFREFQYFTATPDDLREFISIGRINDDQ